MEEVTNNPRPVPPRPLDYAKPIAKLGSIFKYGCAALFGIVAGCLGTLFLIGGGTVLLRGFDESNGDRVRDRQDGARLLGIALVLLVPAIRYLIVAYRGRCKLETAPANRFVAELPKGWPYHPTPSSSRPDPADSVR